MTTLTDIRQALRDGRSLSAAQLLLRTQLSAPQLSRIWRTATPGFLRFGGGRSTRYALRREEPGIGFDIPMYEVNAEGTPSEIARVHFLHGEGTLVLWRGRPFSEHASIPWFVEDIRPQGFLGRAFVNAHPDLGLAAPDTWRVHDVWRVITAYGEDLSGHLLFGEQMLDAFLRTQASHVDAIATNDRPRAYDEAAHRASEGQVPGSCAGGEHPKFTALVSDPHGTPRRVIVKYSPPLSTVEGRRWTDLLVCEHIAQCVLSEAGVPGANSEIVTGKERTHLEVTRFDRIGAHGRRAIASLRMIDAEFIAKSTGHWAGAAVALREIKKISAADAQLLAMLEAFGRLIANTDRHFGNVSFYWNVNDSFALAPVYDMLPMAFVPTSQGMANTLTYVPPPIADAKTLDVWPQARLLAERYWTEVKADHRVSAEFKATCVESALRVL